MSAHDEKTTYALNVNGFSVNAVYDRREESVIDGVIDAISDVRRRMMDSGEGKTIVFLSGPPGAGKSTFALSVCQRARQRKTQMRFECLGLDGFHKKRSVLMNEYTLISRKRTLLNDIKGAPETFDAEAFKQTLFDVKNGTSNRWPVYDRRIHDVSDEKMTVEGDVLLIEGNWLMLSGIWAQARRACDISFSLDADDCLLKERLIQRKMRGGKTHEEAVMWYQSVDGPNIRIYREKSAKCDVTIIRKNGILVFSSKNS